MKCNQYSSPQINTITYKEDRYIIADLVRDFENNSLEITYRMLRPVGERNTLGGHGDKYRNKVATVKYTKDNKNHEPIRMLYEHLLDESSRAAINRKRR